MDSIVAIETVNTLLNSLSDDELRSIINDDSSQETRLDELIEKCPIVSISSSVFLLIN